MSDSMDVGDIGTIRIDELLDLPPGLGGVEYASRQLKSFQHSPPTTQFLREIDLVDEEVRVFGRLVILVPHRERDDRVPMRLQQIREVEEATLCASPEIVEAVAHQDFQLKFSCAWRELGGLWSKVGRARLDRANRAFHGLAELRGRSVPGPGSRSPGGSGA